MGKRIIGIIAFAAIAVAAGWNYQQNMDKVELSDLALANVEALARDETITGNICHYKGTSVYADYIPCTADYPNIGRCGTRENAFYSQDKAQCYK